ncbi:hypothetical protein FHL05_12205 [Lactobacillus halodurans]|uniref:PepSY domain-containing protein n=1 Tax=Companilactobacillus halodurans TaxID=2584183 RepID=A0A5P1A1F5_9LACO|nr:hypothetical protein [Companilactobacillus halodurans]
MIFSSWCFYFGILLKVANLIIKFAKKILRKKTENLDDDEQNGQARKDDKVKLDKLLSLNKITKIAEKKLKNSQAKEFSLEQELGVTYWEVNVKHGSKEKEVKINAITGKILNTEND